MASMRKGKFQPDLGILKPAAKAYALGYLTSIGPRLLSFLRTSRRKDLSTQDRLRFLYTILTTATQLNRFPTACGIIASGATVAPRLLLTLRTYVTQLGLLPRSHVSTTFISRIRFLCSFLAAWLAFDLLNRDKQWARKRELSRASNGDSRSGQPSISHDSYPTSPANYAGKTIDFTSFALTRALDVSVVYAWTRTRTSTWHPEQWAPRLSNVLRHNADPWVFATSAGVVMWSWFYSPERLPREYNHWISNAAGIDLRIIEALRQARRGEYVYGQSSEKAYLLQSLCRDLKFPEAWGDPAKTAPIPCELYHGGTGKSCEIHGLSRLWRGFIFAFKLYLPLQLFSKLRSPSLAAFTTALKSAAQSSSFLATFVGIFYYSVCLARTRLGPKIFSRKTISMQTMDNGLCVLAGCLLCGCSIFLEKPGRRQEIASFVAPRALSTLMPRVYEKKYRKREQVVFAASVAVVLSAVQGSDGPLVRGVLGKVLKSVLGE